MTARRFWVSAALVGLLCLGGGGLVPTVHGADVNALMTKGRKLYERGKYGDALKVFLRVRETDPGHLEAREYVNRCMDQIVEREAGEKAKRVVRERRTGAATLPPSDAIPAWAIPPGTSPKPSGASAAGPGQAMLTRRDLLSDQYRRRVARDGAVQIRRQRNRVEAVFFMNRLFLPFTDTPAPDTHEVLAAAARDIREGQADTVLLRAVDSLTPAVRNTMADLPSRRCAWLYNAILQEILSGPRGDPAAGLTVSDLDD